MGTVRNSFPLLNGSSTLELSPNVFAALESGRRGPLRCFEGEESFRFRLKGRTDRIVYDAHYTLQLPQQGGVICVMAEL